jgi:hypothetical protein
MSAVNVRLLGAGDFELGEEIGRGCDGKVSAARITAVPAHPLCVAKEHFLLTEANMLGLVKEQVELVSAEQVAMLNHWAAFPPHPNLLPLLGVHYGTVKLERAAVQNVPLYVFSPRYSTTVDQWVQTHREALAPDELVKKLVDIARQVAAGLAHIHALGFLHRDLQLSNIFCNSDATVVVVGDLDLMMGDARTSINLLHMAPEMLSTKCVSGGDLAQYSIKADVWSFAMLICEMLARANPASAPLEGFLQQNYASKVVFDENHKADPQRTAELQAKMRELVNAHIAEHHPLCADLFGMRTQHRGLQSPSVMEVALQLDPRLRGSMAHCLTALEFAQSRDAATVTREEHAALQATVAQHVEAAVALRGDVDVLRAEMERLTALQREVLEAGLLDYVFRSPESAREFMIRSFSNQHFGICLAKRLPTS